MTASASPSRAPGARSKRSREPLLPERLLAKLWRAKTGRSLRTTDGRRLKVVYPGRPAPGHGPDFRDAVIELQGRRVTGPVELHRTPSDWYAHGHDRDPAYDNVVLHVVSRRAQTRRPADRVKDPPLPATATPPTHASPETLLTIELHERQPPEEGALRPGLLAGLASLPETALRDELRDAGLLRFDERATLFAGQVQRRGMDQALLASIMDCLGYSENRVPFAQLADTLPLALLRSVALTVVPRRREGFVQRLLLSGAGLGPVGNEWNSMIGTAPMPPACWRSGGVRPGNRPARRITGLAAYLVRSLDMGLAAWLTASYEESPGGLLRELTVREAGTTYVGDARACEIVVNAVLPALAAQANLAGDGAAVERVRSTYRGLPALPDNTLTKEAKLLLGQAAPKRLGACEQQGLIHLYRAAVVSATTGPSAAAQR